MKRAGVKVISPITVVIDTAEQQPFSFAEIKGDAKEEYRLIHVPVIWKSLGRHPNSLGDYSLLGYEGQCNVERKSMSDAHGTILGWDGDRDVRDVSRRERFENELANLAGIESALVVVECSLETLLTSAPCWGKKSSAVNAKILHRSIVAYMQDYQVPWLFAGSRRLAEITTYRFLARFHRKRIEGMKERRKAAIEGMEVV